MTAVVTDADKSLSVMVYKETEAGSGLVKKTPIKAKLSENGNLIVISGLDVGQTIVAAGAAQVSDGETVRPFTGYSN